MPVVISPNLKKHSDRIDTQGNFIDPGTKEIVAPAEEVYTQPIQPEIKPEPKSDSLGDKIQKMIEEKVNKIVEKKIEEALKNLL